MPCCLCRKLSKLQFLLCQMKLIISAEILTLKIHTENPLCSWKIILKAGCDKWILAYFHCIQWRMTMENRANANNQQISVLFILVLLSSAIYRDWFYITIYSTSIIKDRTSVFVHLYFFVSLWQKIIPFSFRSGERCVRQGRSLAEIENTV